MAINTHLGQQHPLKILLVEPNPVNRKLVSALLKKMSYDTDIATDSDTMLFKTRDQAYDLIFLNEILSDMNFVIAAQLVRQQASNRPYLVVLGNQVHETLQETDEPVDVDNYLSLPLRINALSNLLPKVPGGQLKPSASAPVGPLIDMNAYRNLCEMLDNDQEMITELIDVFLDDAVSYLDDLDKALAADDAAQLRMAAHTLKSSSANLGAMGMSTLCKRLETDARNNDTSNAVVLVPEIRKSFNQTKLELVKLPNYQS